MGDSAYNVLGLPDLELVSQQSKQGVLARFSEKCFARGEKKPDFFNPFPKKYRGFTQKP